jgi:hypothetical protein
VACLGMAIVGTAVLISWLQQHMHMTWPTYTLLGLVLAAWVFYGSLLDA